jgi:hypothetical protein
VTGTVEALPSAVLYVWRGSLASPEARAGRLSSFLVWRLMLQLSLARFFLCPATRRSLLCLTP